MVTNSSFSDFQFESIYPDNIEMHYWNSTRNRIIRDILLNNNCLDKNILEVGCGKAIVVDYLIKNGFTLNRRNHNPISNAMNLLPLLDRI